MDNLPYICGKQLYLQGKKPTEVITTDTIMRTHKKQVITTLATLMLLFAAGCGRQSIPTTENLKDSLHYYGSHFSRLSGEVGYDSVRALYSGLMRSLPEHPSGEADSIAIYMGRILMYYYNCAILKQRESNGATDIFREAMRLPDSLLHSDHAFYRDVMRPELLTLCAQLHMVANDRTVADSMAQALVAMPVMANDTRAVSVYHTMAWTAIFCCPATDTAIRLQERAVAARERGGVHKDEGNLYSRMSYFYQLAGRYEEAMRYIQRAIDYYTELGRKQSASTVDGPYFPIARNADGSLSATSESLLDNVIHAYGNLTALYGTLGLCDKALEANAVALRFAREANDNFLLDLYRMRAECFREVGQPDSCFVCLDSALAVIGQQPQQRKYLTGIALQRTGILLDAYPDSAAHYIRATQAYLADSAMVTVRQLPRLFHVCGMALYYTPSRKAESIPYLEEARLRYIVLNDPVNEANVTDLLLNAYAETGRYARMGQLYPTYRLLRDSLFREDRQRSVIAANIRYETGRKMRENELLTAEVQLKQRTLLYTWTLVGLLAALLLSVVIYMRQRQRYHRRISEAHLSQISSLLNAHRQLHHRNNSLARELIMVSNPQTAADMRAAINTHLFNTDKEADFRHSFAAFYPGYLPSLRRICPDLTRTDELVAMLLLLELSNDKIALTLGITKASVNKARSRMRKRMGLEKEVKLEEFLKGVGEVS